MRTRRFIKIVLLLSIVIAVAWMLMPAVQAAGQPIGTGPPTHKEEIKADSGKKGVVTEQPMIHRDVIAAGELKGELKKESEQPMGVPETIGPNSKDADLVRDRDLASPISF